MNIQELCKLIARNNPHGLTWEKDVALVMWCFNHNAFPLTQNKPQAVVREKKGSFIQHISKFIMFMFELFSHLWKLKDD